MSPPYGEFTRLARLAPMLAATAPGAKVGIGDDAAVVTVGGSDIIFCIDTIVADRHFTRAVSTPTDIGWKAIAVNVSDVAAMGGHPRAAVIALNRPETLSEDDVDALYAGIAEAGATYGVAVIGGDTVTSQELSISVAMIGEAGPCIVTRDGARSGDEIIVIGSVGAAAAALESLAQGEEPSPDHLEAHRRPKALWRTGPAVAAAGVTAMIDISDGLGTDLGRIADASECTLHIHADAITEVFDEGTDAVFGADAMDRCLGAGEGFALAVTSPPQITEEILAAVRDVGEANAVVVGHVSGGPAEVWLEQNGTTRPVSHLGFDHG